jgi:hypothetical protein
MANVCTGVSVTFNSVALGELTEITTNIGGGLPLGRGSTVANVQPWAFDAGTIDIKCLSSAQISIATYGKKATLDISGGGLTVTTKAICQSLQMAGKVNDVARYSATFKIALE